MVNRSIYEASLLFGIVGILIVNFEITPLSRGLPSQNNINKSSLVNERGKIEYWQEPNPTVQPDSTLIFDGDIEDIADTENEIQNDDTNVVLNSEPINTPSQVNVQDGNDIGSTFDGTYLSKLEAAKFLQTGVEVVVLDVGDDYFDIQLKTAEKYRIESPIRPKYVLYQVNEYGFSDIIRKNGFEKGYEGVLKSSPPPENIMGAGIAEKTLGVTPEASDGVEANDVIPIFTLSTSKVKGPNDYLITEEMDYDPKSPDKSINKRWFEILKGSTKGIIWTIFEQSNRYFTMVDKREWDRFTPGHIFEMMQKFEYMIPIPDRISAVRNPKNISDEEKQKARFILHDYSAAGVTIRVLVPAFQEFEKASVLEKITEEPKPIGYKEIITVLSDAEMGDGEKFTWNNPIKVLLMVNGQLYNIYLPTQSVIEIEGKQYKLPKSLK